MSRDTKKIIEDLLDPAIKPANEDIDLVAQFARAGWQRRSDDDWLDELWGEDDTDAIEASSPAIAQGTTPMLWAAASRPDYVRYSDEAYVVLLLRTADGWFVEAHGAAMLALDIRAQRCSLVPVASTTIPDIEPPPWIIIHTQDGQPRRLLRDQE